MEKNPLGRLNPEAMVPIPLTDQRSHSGNSLMMDNLLFRLATGDDAEAVAALHTESWRDAYRGIMPAWYLDGPIAGERIGLWRSRFSSSDADRRYVLLAESGGELAGFVCVLLDEEPRLGACLDNLHVAPGLKSRGIGRQLFARAAEWVTVKEPGWPIHLWVFEANRGGRRFYDAAGGEILDYRAREVLEGIHIPSVLYVWKDLKKLYLRLTRPFGRRP